MTVEYIAENPGKFKAPSPWTAERVERLKILWGKGLSASQIAWELQCGTRMAVIGKARRLGLAYRAQRPTMARLPRRPTKPKPKRIAKARPPRIRDMTPPTDYTLIRDAALDVARVAFGDLEPHHCRWPVGDPVQGYCGHEKILGQSYCKGHCDRAYGAVLDDPPPSVRHVIRGDVTTAAAVDEFLEVAA